MNLLPSCKQVAIKLKRKRDLIAETITHRWRTPAMQALSRHRSIVEIHGQPIDLMDLIQAECIAWAIEQRRKDKGLVVTAEGIAKRTRKRKVIDPSDKASLYEQMAGAFQTHPTVTDDQIHKYQVSCKRTNPL
jgi:hypothetical protein